VRPRVVIFEDEEALRFALRTLFTQRGYEVFTYPDPGMCPLNAVGECPCPPTTTCADVIISDVQMPTTNGIDFIQQLLEKKCSHPHFALMSGDWTDAAKERAVQLGCKVLSKPFQFVELIEWLQQVERTLSPERRLFDWQHGCVT
jgi:DNA-binding response OmpR family regulator